jgi:hypothetical protein
MYDNVQNESRGKQTGSESEPVFRTKMATMCTLRAGFDWSHLSQLLKTTETSRESYFGRKKRIAFNKCTLKPEMQTL